MADNADPFPKLGTVYKSSSCQVAGKLNWMQSSTPNALGQGKVNQKLSVHTNGRSKLANGNSCLVGNADPRNLVASGNAWPQADHPASEKNYAAALEQKPNWSALAKSFQSQGSRNGQSSSHSSIPDDKNDNTNIDDVDDDDSDILYDSDDDLFIDDSESESENSYEKSKKSKLFKSFFDDLDKLGVEEINSLDRKWHCPACRGGQGAIDWYYGMEPLMTHAKTIKARRVKLHREFAEVLDEVLRTKGISVISVGETYGRWEGLKEADKDHKIVWPPMVIIQNTRYEMGTNDKWTGMGNEELLDYFSSYAAHKARHSYGPQGHRGISVLIFDSSTAGYLEAVRLHKHFIEQGRDRDTWDLNPILFAPGGKRQLYGYLAKEGDMVIFNQHFGDKKVKFEMVSYLENVERQIKQINDDVQQITHLKNTLAKHQKKEEVLVESLSTVSAKMRRVAEENRIVRRHTQSLNNEHQEMMDALEQSYESKIDLIHRAISAREEKFEKMQQEQREIAKQLFSNSFSGEDHRLDDIAKFISIQDKGMAKFEAVRDKIIERHEEEIAAMERRYCEVKRKYWEEKVELNKKLESEIAQAMESLAASMLTTKNN